MGVAGGIMFTVAHELLHGPGRLDRWLANALLATAAYQHWAASHLGHHVKARMRKGGGQEQGGGGDEARCRTAGLRGSRREAWHVPGALQGVGTCPAFARLAR